MADRMAVERATKYAHFVALCEGISKPGTSKDRKRNLLQNFVEGWRMSYHQAYPSNPQPPSETFFPFLRLLLPDADRDRPAYGIKETVLARMFIQELSLSKGGKASETLLHWKKNKPQGADQREVADFGGVAYHVLQDRLSKDGNETAMSIYDINKFLDELAEANGIGGEDRKERTNRAFREVLRRLDRLEWKWLIRIILKDARLNMGEECILSVYHPDAAELYDTTTSLSGVCVRLMDPKVRLSQIEISLFSPFRPMLAEGWNPAKLQGILRSNEHLAEIKYDGERCQIHKSGNQFKYFSRSKVDNTEKLGGSPSEGNLTKHIAKCFAPQADSFILDGEICAFDIKENCIATKTDSYAIKLLTGENGYQICFVAFDCLFYNGKTITGYPFSKRLALLKDLFQAKEGRLYHATRKEVTTPNDCYEFLNEAIDQNEEGIVLKQLSSIYKPNARTAGWWKVKPDYVDSLSDQLDILVVGGYYGTGRRTGFSHFLLAVAQDPEKPGQQPKKFLSFCKVGTGYTYKELQEMGLKLAPHIRAGVKPAWLTIVGEKEKPDAYIEPDKSFIVKVSAAQLLDSANFATGCTLRFPRLKECRTDKSWYECMTLSQLLDLKSQSGGRLGAKHVPDGHFEEGGSPTKKQKTAVPRMAVGRLAEHFRAADTSGVAAQGNIFAGKEFHVVDGDQAHCKQDMEKLIVSYGGTAVQDVSPGRTFCVIANKKTIRVANLIKSNNYDVVYPSWVHRCVAAKEVFPWHPKDLMFVREQTQKLMASAFDKYGDSFTENISVNGLERLLNEMEHKEISRTKLVNLEDRYYSEFPLLGLFRTYTAYFDKYAEIGEPTALQKLSACMTLAEVEFVASGGLVVDKVAPDVTHFVVASNQVDRLGDIKKLNHDRTEKFHLVSEKWVLKSAEEGMILEERSFALKTEAETENSPSLLLATVF